jgi:hypothetical protein
MRMADCPDTDQQILSCSQQFRQRILKSQPGLAGRFLVADLRIALGLLPLLAA